MSSITNNHSNNNIQSWSSPPIGFFAVSTFTPLFSMLFAVTLLFCALLPSAALRVGQRVVALGLALPLLTAIPSPSNAKVEYNSAAAAAASMETLQKRDAAVLSTTGKVGLKAADMLKIDIEDSRKKLTEILNSIQLYSSYAEKQDYASIRSGLRSEPAGGLRKTCKLLKKYLPSAQNQINFEEKYVFMLDKIDDFDVLALKRLQGTGVPAQGEVDEEMKQKIAVAVQAYEDMLKVIEE